MQWILRRLLLISNNYIIFPMDKFYVLREVFYLTGLVSLISE